jgi:tetratricopeptide (TPR) repeat protein
MTLSTLALVLGFAFAVQRLGEIQHGKNLLSRTALTTRSVASFHPHSEKVLTIAEQWPASVELVNACIMANPPGSERLSLTRTAVEHYPWNAQAHEWLAQDLAVAGRCDDAINALKNAINLNPGYLPRRQHLAELLDYAANTLPTRANDFHRQAESERQHIAELSPIVHPRNRLIIKPGSTLPVQPAAQ